MDIDMNIQIINHLDKFLNDADNSTLNHIFDGNQSKNISGIWKQGESLGTALLLCVSFGTLIIVSSVLNICVCHVILKTKKMHTVTNVFLANMAVSDIILVVLNVPLSVARHIMHQWTLGSVLCSLLNYSLIVSVYVSSFTLTAIALDRQQVLLYPLRPRITKRKAILILFLIWISACGLALPFGLYTRVEFMNIFVDRVKRCQSAFPNHKWEQYFTIVTILVQYIIPLIVIGFTYSRIVHKLWLRTHLGFVTETQRVVQIQAKRKSIQLLVSVFIVFALCWMPLNLYHMLTDFHPNTTTFNYNSTTFFIFFWIANSSSCINPVLYCWMNPTFRKEMISRFRCCGSLSTRSYHSDVEMDEIFTRDSCTRAHTPIRSNHSSVNSHRKKEDSGKFTYKFTFSCSKV